MRGLRQIRRIVEILVLLSFIVIGAAVVWNTTSHSSIPADAPSPQNPGVGEPGPVLARHWVELGDGRVQCRLCFRNCIIPEGQRGYCEARENRDGRLYSLVYGMIGAAHIDPVEKEPLLHFLPGTSSLCFGTASCNFKCTYCHNWHLAVRRPEEVSSFSLSPEAAVERAKKLGCRSISFTYNEPTVFYEWMYDVAKLAKESGLKTYFHTNGGINPGPLRELLKYMDAVCVDLKGFTAQFFTTTSFSQLEPVLTTLKTVKESGVWLEITCLIIPTLNDDMEQIEEMCRWIKENLGTEVPVQFSRFFPAYKLVKLPPTPTDTLERAREIAVTTGLKYVTIGNVPGHAANSTYCPKCGSVVIERVGFSVMANNLDQGRCKFCGYPIPGVWE